VSIEECDLRKIEEQAEEARGNQEALDSGAAGDGGDASALENQNAELVNAMAGEINALIGDKVKENLEACGNKLLQLVGPIDGAGGAGGEGAGAGGDGSLTDEGLNLNLTNERDSYLSCPENMTRSAGITPLVGVLLFKTKFACDINFALIIDEYMAKAISKGVLDPNVVKGLKLD